MFRSSSILFVALLGALLASPACEDEKPSAGEIASSAETTAVGSNVGPPPGLADKNFEERTRWAHAEVLGSAPACPDIDANKLYRFVEGLDACMVELSEADIATLLQDTFATTVLRTNERPTSVDAIVEDMKASKLNQSSFLVGEGTQIPASTQIPRSAPRNLRYVVVWTDPRDSAASVFLSAAPGGHSGFLQVVAWDAKNSVFNFFEFRKQVGGKGTSAWSWAGETTMAPKPQTHGVGCFDCHHNGVTIMKELTRPWNNWQSELAQISPSVVPKEVASEPLFQARKGGDQLENLIKGAYQTYYDLWLRANYQRGSDGVVKLTQTDLMLRRLTTNTTVNFAASQVQSRGRATSPQNADLTGIPINLFLWDDLLRTALGLEYTFPPQTFKRDAFDTYLQEHTFELIQDESPGYTEQGSTWFSFFTPVPAAEDQYLILSLKQANVFTDKFVAAILMVDFPNPVFSSKRPSLQTYADAIVSGTIKGVDNSMINDFVAAVESAASKQPACTGEFLTCSAEQQFLTTWNLSDDEWHSTTEKRVQDYIDASIKGMTLDEVMRLAQQRRESFTTTPVIKNLNEFSLLLPKNDLSKQ